MQAVSSAGNDANSTERDRKWSQWQARKKATNVKRGKIRSLCQAREMMRPVPSAIGNGASDKCERRQPVSSAGKIGNLCQTQEIWQSFLSAEKFVSSVNSERDCTVSVTCTGKQEILVKRGKFCCQHIARGTLQSMSRSIALTFVLWEWNNVSTNVDCSFLLIQMMTARKDCRG